jgi:uncharacterized protein (DUF1501 family)
MITRRALLQTGGMVAFASGVVAPMFLSRAAKAATARDSRKVLVVVYQRFGMDGLLAVTPYADESLRKLRPDLMLPAPDSRQENSLVELGNGFGLNPWLAALAPLYREGSLAFIQAAGSPDATRSHLDAAQWWESGTPGVRATPDGWLNRAVHAAGDDPSRALRMVSMTAEQPRAVYGTQPVVAITDLGQLESSLAQAQAHADAATRAVQKMYANSADPQLRQAAHQSVQISRALTSRKQTTKAEYPHTSFGKSLRDIATLITADVGLQVAFAESRHGTDEKGSWDTHTQALDTRNRFGFPAIAQDFSQSVAAFWQDLGKRREDVVLVTHTDFGRNVVQNADRGCDHGRATTMLVLGGNVDGGRVHGRLPEHFEREALEDQIDLPVTTDYRSVLASLAGAQLGIATSQDARVFPGWNGARCPITRS